MAVSSLTDADAGAPSAKAAGRPPVRVLVDHGCGNHNLGDIAQLEGAVSALLARPGLQLVVRDTPCNDRLSVFRGDVQRISFSIPRYQASWLRNTPGAWRWADAASRALSSLNLAYARRRGLLGHPGWAAAQRVASQADALWLVGGGYMTDSFAANLYEKSCLVHAFALQSKPIVFSGQQIGPFRTRLARASAYAALRRARLVGIREPTDSRAHSQAAGLPEDRIVLAGDDSLGLAADDQAADALLRQHGLADQAFVAINFRLANYAGTSDRDAAAFGDYVRRLQTALQAPLVYVPVSMASGDSDLAFGRRLRAEWPSDTKPPVVLGDSLGAAVGKSLLARAKVAIGGSYHFCTFARSAGASVVALYTSDYYRQKAQGMASFWRDGVLPLHFESDSVSSSTRRTLSFVQSQADNRPTTGSVTTTWQAFMSRGIGNLFEHRTAEPTDRD